jgi:CBS domain-containing protein
MKAQDVMTTTVVSVGPGQGTRELARILRDKGISAVPVVDDGIGSTSGERLRVSTKPGQSHFCACAVFWSRPTPMPQRANTSIGTMSISPMMRPNWQSAWPRWTHASCGRSHGGGETVRASRLFGLARDIARLDDRRWAVAGPSASSAPAASAASAARLSGRTGANRRLGARLVRGSRSAVPAQ